MQLAEFINQLPPGQQQEVRRLLQEYNSAVNPQDRALAQRRLEPYTRAMMQSPDLTGTRDFIDGAARQKYLKNTIDREIPKPIPAEILGSNLTPDNLIKSGIPAKNLTTLGNRFPLENQEKLSPLKILDPPMAQMPAKARANTNISMPAPPAVSPTAAPPASLLDPETEESSIFDDPMRMGLLQAGLGLMSAPKYSTNPNDVTLSSGIARGLGGFIEGYGGTRQRLTEEERQRLDDDFKRKQIESTLTYQKLLGGEAAGRTKQIEELLTRPAKNQEEYEAKVREIFPDPENKTGQALIAAGYEEGSKMLAKYAGGMTETQRTGLVTKIKQDPILPEDSKTMLLEMVGERDFEGKLANSYTQINNTINQIKDDLKPPKELKGDAIERAENILIEASPGAKDIRVSNAFNRLFMNPLSETQSYNPETQRVEIKRIYPAIPLDIQNKFPELVAQRRQLEQNQSTKPPTLSQRQEENRAAELKMFHDEINEKDYDEPEGVFSTESLREGISSRFASDEYLLKRRAQERWIENVLRAASGAAIAVSEYDGKRAQYFPEPGEGPAAVEAKSQARDVVLQRALLNLATQAEQERKQEAIPKTEVEDPDAALLEN